jgi:hypothetical protein
MVGFPSEREMAGIVCKIPINRKYTKYDWGCTVGEFGELLYKVKRDEADVVVFWGLYFIVQNLWIGHVAYDCAI